MNVFVLSWRQSLPAAALAAVLSGAPMPVAAAEDQPDRPAVKAEREGDRGEARPGREEPRREEPRGEAREGERREGPREGDRPEARREGDRERRDAPPPEVMEKRRQLEERAQDLRRKLESLRPEQDAEARELRGALARIEAEFRDLPRPPEGADREPLMRRLEEIKAAMQRAREAGRREEVERLEREGRELLERLGERPRPEAEAAEMQRRMEHVRVAIENLHAAGLHDQANAVAREAEQWMRQRGLPPGRPPQGGPPPELAPFQEHVERAMGEMREQMQELNRQLEELRQRLRELGDRPPR